VFYRRCDDFVTLCEVHREFYLSSEDAKPEEKCCGAIFNSTPFFSNTGTCFTTHAEIVETIPFSFSSIKVWLNMQTANSPGYIYCLNCHCQAVDLKKEKICNRILFIFRLWSDLQGVWRDRAKGSFLYDQRRRSSNHKADAKSKESSQGHQRSNWTEHL